MNGIFSLKLYFIRDERQHAEYSKAPGHNLSADRIVGYRCAVFPFIIESRIVIQGPGIVAAVRIVQAKGPFLVAPPFGLSMKGGTEIELMEDRKSRIVALVKEKFQPGVSRR